MTAAASEAASWNPTPTIALRVARAYGPLRAVSPAQAPVVRRAAQLDRRVLPRWQRLGDGVHVWADPSAYTAIPAWRTREHWVTTVVPAAVAAKPEVLAQHQVSQQSFLAWAETVSLFAHRRTGRRCIVRPDRLGELAELSKRTVQRAQKAAEALGLYVIVMNGRMLTEAETYQARSQGSCQRGLSNEAALTVPSWLPRAQAWAASPARRRAGLHLAAVDGRRVDGARSTGPVDKGRLVGSPDPVTGTPTRGGLPHLSPLTVTSSLGPRSAGRSGTASGGPAPTREPARRKGRVYDQDALEVARALVSALPWLAGVAPGRLEPMLRRFTRARLSWTAGDFLDAFDATNRRLNRPSMTGTLVRRPIGLVASYLRDLDVDADHPRLWDEEQRELAPGWTGRPSARARRTRDLLELRRSGATGVPVAAPDAAAAAMAELRRIVADSKTTNSGDSE